MPTHFVNELILIIVAAFIGGFVARTIKLPPVVGYLLSGVAFGILGKNFITSFDSLFALSEIGVSLLLFTLGFEISLDSIKKINKKILLAGFLQVVLTAIILVPVLMLFQFGWQTSILLSMLFSFSSTAVVVKILEEKGMLSNFPGNNVFIFLLIQDLFIVPILFLMPFLFKSGFSFPADVISFFVTALKPLGIFVLIYLLSKIFLSKMLNVLFRYPSQELTILATIFTAVCAIGFLTAAGLPPSIAAFFAGVLISEEGKNLAPLAAIRPLRDILLVIFFVLIGMLVNVEYAIAHLPFIFLACGLVLLVKFFVQFFILRWFKFLPSSNFFISSHMANIGEFAAVLGQIAFAKKFITSQSYESLLSMFVISLIAIPFWIRFVKAVFNKHKNSSWVKKLAGESHYFSTQAYGEIANHIVICGHGRVGKEVRNLLEIADIPYVVIDFNRKAIDELTKNSKLALYGDPTDNEVLRSGGIEKAKILVVAVPDSFTQKMIIKNALSLNPKLIILCRSHVEEDKYELVNLGVNTIVIPEFEAGLRIGRQVLELLGFADRDTNDMIRKIRKFHLVQ